MSDITINLPDGLGTVSFPEGTSSEVMTREAGNAYLRAKGTAAGKADASSRDRGVSQAFGNGALMGLGDEATATARSAAPALSNWMMSGPALQRDESIGGSPTPQTVSTAPTYAGRYEEELARERAKKKTFSEDNPILSGVSTVAGAAAPMVLAGTAGIPTGLAMGGKMLPNIVKSAITGAGYGGAFGFNEGEGDLAGRLGSAGEGAAVGSVLGPAMYVGGRGVSALADYAKTTGPGQAVLSGVRKAASMLDNIGSVKPKSVSAAAPEGGGNIPGDNMMTYAADQIRSAVPSAEDAVKQRAVSYLATAVERGKMTAEQAQAELNKLGIDATLADVNKSLFRTARMTNTLQGETGDLAEKVLTDRAKTYNPRLRSTIEGESPPPEDVYFRGDIPGGNIPEKYAREVGARVYGAMDDAGFANSPALSKIMENPKVSAAIERVLTDLKASRVGTDRSPESVVETMHMVKREIQKIGLDPNGAPSSTAYQWQQTADNFVNALKKANPKLAEADVAYAKAKAVPDYYDAGLNTFGKATTAEGGVEKSSAAVANMLKVADAAQGNASVFGAINAGRAKTGGNVADAIGFARTISQSDDARKKITSVFGEPRAQEIFNAAESVLRFNKTHTGITGGSQSVDKAAELFSTGADFGNAGVKVTPGGIVPRFFQTANDIMQRVSAPNEAVRNKMGQMLINTSSPENQQTIALIAEALRHRNAQRRGASAVGGTLAPSLGFTGGDR